ncbi:MAG: hypothetical protein II938_01565 [Alphaproteobacteria bacterium]|nr:hypothetical protein [Alphaproteobacteria bacterium]
MTNHIKIQDIKPRIQYVANGTLTSYTFPFAIFHADDINIYLDDMLQSSSNYQVTFSTTQAGGTITFDVAPATGKKITIVRQLSIERTSDFQEGGALRANTLNDELDYQIACQQQIAENLNRSMVLPPYAADNDLDLTLPTPSAGKAIIWNNAGTNLENSTIAVNDLESTINGYKTLAQTAATTATTQANLAITKASEAVSAANQLSGARTNCITEIPQDIKLELSSGALVVKSGSKLRVPNGPGVFDEVTIDSDISQTFGSASGSYLIFRKQDNSLSWFSAASAVSGTTPPTTAVLYDTSLNKIRGYVSGSLNSDLMSFPLCVVTLSSGNVTSIDKVFNGFGYIGSTVFVLPGVKGLCPNGRNSDGTPISTEFETTSVLITTLSGTKNLLLTIPVEANVLNAPLTTSVSYDDEANSNLYLGGVVNECHVGSLTLTSNVISNFVVKKSFFALDNNDKQKIVNWGMPNYSAAISISTNYTTPTNGYFEGVCSSSSAYKITIGGTVMVDSGSSSTHIGFPFAIAVPRNTSITFTSISNPKFIPCIGG